MSEVETSIDIAATPEEISAAFRGLARTLHPDTNAAPAAIDRFKVVSAAYRVLSDPSERARYDAGREARVQPAPARPSRPTAARVVAPAAPARPCASSTAAASSPTTPPSCSRSSTSTAA